MLYVMLSEAKHLARHPEGFPDRLGMTVFNVSRFELEMPNP